MNEINNLYQQTILDHKNNPRNYGLLKSPAYQAIGDNPLCGDHLELTLRIRQGKIQAIGFEARGCAISQAAASIMTELVKGKTKAQALAWCKKFQQIMVNDRPAQYPELAVFAGVKNFPGRVKCASLPWHTLRQLLEKES